MAIFSGMKNPKKITRKELKETFKIKIPDIQLRELKSVWSQSRTHAGSTAKTST